MARSAPLHLKPLGRPSLHLIGIPDARDVLAVYIWWLKQQRLRALVQSDLSSEVASSVQSVYGDEDEVRCDIADPIKRVAFDMRSTAFDLCGIGGQFE